jgi:nicotinate phosphoribosyltransferase
VTAWVGNDNLALLTDFYEFTMAQAYHATGASDPATFDLFVRNLPPNRRFLVAAGLEDALSGLEHFRFQPAAVDYLASLDRFTPGFLQYLSSFRFSGDVAAIPEGEVFFQGEPVIRLTAPLPEAQLVETFLLNTIGFQSMIASKATRVAIACGDRSFVDFSARRVHGADAALKAARASFIGGAAATSTSLAGQLYGVPVAGTMAHSFVLSYDSEAEAFRQFARAHPQDAVLLIDTYDTEKGARVAAEVANELTAEGIVIHGVRIDSGDLVRLGMSVRRILDHAGQSAIEIFASGDLDEWRIAEIVASGCPIDSFGVGTRLGTSSDAPNLGVVYKLVEDDGGPVMKLSSGKVTVPGRKQVWRRRDHDLLALESEGPQDGRPLLAEVMAGGTRTLDPEPLTEIRERRAESVAALPSRLHSLVGPEPPYQVVISEELSRLAERTQQQLRG